MLAVVAAAITLYGCGGELALTNSAGTPAVPRTTGAPIVMNCADQALIDSGGFRAENNTWGKGALSGWSQCIGLGMGPGGALAGRWTWNWSNSRGNVTAYPEVIFGQKPGKQSTSSALPKKLSSIRVATVSYDVSSTHTGSGNTAFDIWLTSTGNPSAFSAPPITHELMIWLESYGGMRPDGTLIEQIAIDGSLYNVFVAENIGHGWRYIAFVRPTPQLGAGTIDLVTFLSYVRSKGLATGDEYLASIEFGNEVIRGAGETRLNAYAVTID
jgi:hypothetical protein